MRKKELEAMTVVQLRQLARDLGATLKGRRKAEVIESLLKAARKAVRKTASRKATKPPTKVVRKKATVKAAPKSTPRKTGKAPRRKSPSGGLPSTVPASPPVGEYLEGSVPPSAPGMTELPPEPRRPVSMTKPLPKKTRTKLPRKTPAKRSPQRASMGEAMVTVVAADPRHVFICWELPKKGPSHGHPALRVYMAGEKGPARTFDMLLKRRYGSCYVFVEPGRLYFAEVGYAAPDGTFSSEACSNTTETPHEPAPWEEGPQGSFPFRPMGY